MKRIALAVIALACSLSLASSAYAKDATGDDGVEFGIADDITVLGTGGTRGDADVDVRGFSLFGSDVVGHVSQVSGPGSMEITNSLQVDHDLFLSTGGNIELGTGSKINLQGGANIIVGTGGMVTQFDEPSLPSDVVNLAYFDRKIIGGDAIWKYDPARNHIYASTYSANVGIGLESADVTAKLQVVSTNSADSELFAVGSSADGGLTNSSILSIQATTALGVGKAGLSGSLAIGAVAGAAETIENGTTNGLEANAMLQVKGDGTANGMIATFYDGSTLAAWVKKKVAP